MNYILHINPTKLYDHYIGKNNTRIIKNTKTQNPRVSTKLHSRFYDKYKILIL